MENENLVVDDENAESEEVLKDMVKNLDELPTDVLRQLLNNLEEVEAYNKLHPEEINDNKDNK